MWIIDLLSKKARVAILVALDVVLITVSIWFASLLRLEGELGSASYKFMRGMVYLTIINIGVKITLFYFFKLYSSLWRFAGVYEMLCITAAAFFGNSIMLAYIAAIHGNIPKSILIITFFTDIFLIGGVRFIYRVLRRIIRFGAVSVKNIKRVLIVGNGENSSTIIRELRLLPELNLKPVAIIDNDKDKIGRKIDGIPILGQIKDLDAVAESKRIDEIIIALPSKSGKAIRKVLDECLKTRCKVRILPPFEQMMESPQVISRIRDVNIEDLLGRDPVVIDIKSISSYLKNQVVLVTGGGGSIGSELCRQVASFAPEKLIILDNYENSTYEVENDIAGKYPDLNLHTLIANVREKDRLASIFSKYRPDVVFHAAAHKHVPLMESNPVEAVRNNVFGTLNVVECSDKYKVKKFVLISTDKAVNPVNIMGATKRIAEMIVQTIGRHSSTKFAVVRFGNVLGSNGSVVPLFKKQIEKGGPVTVTHPDVSRYFMTISEAVQLVIEAGAMSKGGEVFVLDMGKPVRIYDLALKLIKLCGLEPDIDIKIEFTGLRPGDKLHEEIIFSEEELSATNNKKIFKAKPVRIDEIKLNWVIKELKELDINKTEEIERLIRTLVPTYKKRS